MNRRSLAEAATTAVAGVALGAGAGSLVGIGLPAAVVAGLNGAIGGWRGVYRWSSANGWVAFALDSTWALATTTSGLAAHLLGALRGRPDYVENLSARQNRHVYRRGFQPRRGFATTLGNVVNGAGDIAHPRRAKLVTDHEDVHVWQARLFGPAYPVLYVGWAAGGAVVGLLVGVTTRRDEPIARVIESCAYYLNPFEWWAYSRDDHWPPTGLIEHLGWKKPAVRSFASFR